MRTLIEEKLRELLGSARTPQDLIGSIRQELAILIESLEEVNDQLRDPKIEQEVKTLKKGLQTVILIEHSQDI